MSLTLSSTAKERELERGLLKHLRDLLLELGRGFSFVGSQVPLKVGGETFYIDLLFYHLRQALGIDAEASYGSPSFGAGVSARFDFAKNAKVQSSSLFMSITATVKLAVLSINTPALTPEAASLIDRPDIFSQRFGNVFVRSMERDGVFILWRKDLR